MGLANKYLTIGKCIIKSCRGTTISLMTINSKGTQCSTSTMIIDRLFLSWNYYSLSSFSLSRPALIIRTYTHA